MLWNDLYVRRECVLRAPKKMPLTAVRYLILWEILHVYRDIRSFELTPALHDLDVFMPWHTWFKSVGDYQTSAELDDGLIVLIRCV